MEPGSEEWLRAALYASVTGLSTSCTAGETVEVLAAWIDGDALCFVYQAPYYDGVLGLRHNTETDQYDEGPPDPSTFGQDIADFAIGEPLGTVADRLRRDTDGVHWWGDLSSELPRLPDSARLRAVIAHSANEHLRRIAARAATPRHGHLARRAAGSDEWVLIAKPFNELWRLSGDEAAAADEEIKRRFNLASLTRGDHLHIVIEG